MDLNFYEKIRGWQAPATRCLRTADTATGRKSALPEPTVKSYVYHLLKALDHMHRNGIFHRDIKPENVLIKGVRAQASRGTLTPVAGG